LPKLAVSPRHEDEVLADLAEVCRAQPEHKAQLRLLLEWLSFGAVIERDGGNIKIGPFGRGDNTIERATEAPAAAPTSTVNAPSKGAVSTSFDSAGGAAGGLNLTVQINVDMAAMATWPPSVVTAFMTGLAQVISAKAAAE